MRLDLAGILLPGGNRRAARARSLVAFGAGLSLLLAAGCSASSSSGGGAVSARIAIGVVPGIDNAPLDLAAKEGIFAEAGLSNVVIKDYPTESDLLAALQSGQVQIAGSDYGSIFYTQATMSAPSLRILADGYDATSSVMEILTLPGSSIKSPTDLANQTVALPSYDTLGTTSVSLEEVAATEVLFNYLGNNDTSVRWQPMPESQEVTALLDHQVKAILVGEPFIFQAESEAGASEVLDAFSGATAGLPLSGYVAMNSWVKDSPTAVADFQDAIAKAQAQAQTAGEVQQLLPGYTGMTTEDADLATIGTYPTSTSVANLQTVVRLMADHNIITVGPGDSWDGVVSRMVVGAG
jgi:NitT/TauT family transport system substrate-binding protein